MFNAVFCLRNVFTKPSNSILITWIIPPCRLTVIMEMHNCPFNRGNSRFWKKQKKKQQKQNQEPIKRSALLRHFLHFQHYWALSWLLSKIWAFFRFLGNIKALCFTIFHMFNAVFFLSIKALICHVLNKKRVETDHERLSCQ